MSQLLISFTTFDYTLRKINFEIIIEYLYMYDLNIYSYYSYINKCNWLYSSYSTKRIVIIHANYICMYIYMNISKIRYVTTYLSATIILTQQSKYYNHWFCFKGTVFTASRHNKSECNDWFSFYVRRIATLIVLAIHVNANSDIESCKSHTEYTCILLITTVIIHYYVYEFKSTICRILCKYY